MLAWSRLIRQDLRIKFRIKISGFGLNRVKGGVFCDDRQKFVNHGRIGRVLIDELSIQYGLAARVVDPAVEPDAADVIPDQLHTAAGTDEGFMAGRSGSPDRPCRFFGRAGARHSQGPVYVKKYQLAHI